MSSKQTPRTKNDAKITSDDKKVPQGTMSSHSSRSRIGSLQGRISFTTGKRPSLGVVESLYCRLSCSKTNLGELPDEMYEELYSTETKDTKYGMDPKHRRILNECRALLVKNIIWTPQLMEQLNHYRMLSDTMQQEIEKLETREDKNIRLIDFVLVRGAKAFDRFCDILQMTGHWLLADTLREEDDYRTTNEFTKFIDVREIFKAVPILDRSTNPQQKQQIQNFLRDKIREELAKYNWKESYVKEKGKALETKQQQLDQQWTHENVTSLKNKTIEELETICVDYERRHEAQKKEIKRLMQHIKEINEQHCKDMDVQLRSNKAESRTIERLEAVITDDADVLRTIRVKLKDQLKPLAACDDCGYMLDDRAEENSTLLENFMKFLSMADAMREEFEHVKSDKDFILHFCGKPTSKTDLITANVREIFTEFNQLKDDHIVELEDEVAALRLALKVFRERQSFNSRSSINTALAAKTTDDSNDKLKATHSHQIHEIPQDQLSATFQMTHKASSALAPLTFQFSSLSSTSTSQKPLKVIEKPVMSPNQPLAPITQTRGGQKPVNINGETSQNKRNVPQVKAKFVTPDPKGASNRSRKLINTEQLHHVTKIAFDDPFIQKISQTAGGAKETGGKGMMKRYHHM